MKKTLSATFTTFVFKFIFSTLWIGGFGLGTLMLFIAGQDEKWTFLIAWVVGSFFIYGSCVRLKVVQIDDKFLYISNFRKEISMPISEIANVAESYLINLHPIFISFKNKTAFGKTIMFTPKGFYLRMRHPIANELRDIVNKSNVGS